MMTDPNRELGELAARLAEGKYIDSPEVQQLKQTIEIARHNINNLTDTVTSAIETGRPVTQEVLSLMLVALKSIDMILAEGVP